MEPILPAIIYLTGALSIPFLKGAVRNFFIILIPVAGLVNLLLLHTQTGWIFPFSGFEVIFLSADTTSLFMGYIFAVMAVLTAIYSIHIKDIKHHIFSLLYVGSAMGILFAGDFITFYLFWEIMMVAATVLICYNGEKIAVKAAFRYLLMHLFGGGVLLAGILLNYMYTDTMSMTIIQDGAPALLILIGVGINAAFLPFHTWLPDAYSKAPFTSSLLLSVFTTKIAIYTLARLFPGMGSIAYIGALMALFGAAFAMLQNNGLKILSYSIISSVGFILAAIGTPTPDGLNAGLLSSWNHILYNSLLFMCMGAVIYRTGKQNLSEMGGLSKQMPITFAACLIAAAAMSGIPAFNGFISKFMIYEAVYQNLVLYWTLKVASVLAMIAIIRFIYFTFQGNNAIESREAPLHMYIPMGVISLMIMAGGLVPALFTGLLPYSLETSAIFSLRNIIDSLLPVAIAMAIFIIGAKNIFQPGNRQLPDLDILYALLLKELLLFVKNPVSVLKSWIDLAYYKFCYVYVLVFKQDRIELSLAAQKRASLSMEARKLASEQPAPLDLLPIGSSMLLCTLIVALFLLLLLFEKLL